LAPLALAATALIAGPAVAAPAHHGAAAVLVQTDDVHRNVIIAYDRAADGTLRRAGTYPTGGRGGILDGSVVDHLASQGSLAYSAGRIARGGARDVCSAARPSDPGVEGG
jgi:hypothetical protein